MPPVVTSIAYSPDGQLLAVAGYHEVAPLAAAELGIMMAAVHLLRRAGYSEEFRAEVARVMEYQKAYDLYRHDIEPATA